MNYFKLGMMMAEWKDDCARIDQLGFDAFEDNLKTAYAKILNGDADGLEHNLGKAETALESVKKAKIEAGLRIADKHGLDRDAIEAKMKQILH